MTKSHSVLLAATTAWIIGNAKLMSTAPMNRRGSRMRALNWLRSPCPHMIRYDAHSVTSTNALFASAWTVGSNCVMVAFWMKSWVVSRSVVRSTKSNQTLSKSPRLSLSRTAAT